MTRDGPDDWGWAHRVRRRERAGRDLRRRRVGPLEGVGPHDHGDRRPGGRARARRRRARAHRRRRAHVHPARRDQFDVAAFHEHFGTSHDMWESKAGGGMRWAATAPYDAAEALRDGQGDVHPQHVRRRVGDAARRDGRRARASRTRRSASSRTSRCRSAGSPSPSTSPPSPGGTCTSSAPPRSSSARSRWRAAATPTSTPAR